MNMIKEYLAKIMICLILVFTGCAVSVIVRDDLPVNAEKGYVEFYSFELTSLPDDEKGNQVNIFTDNNGVTKYEGSLNSAGNNSYGDFIRLRLAKIPGEYVFTVNIPTLKENINVAAKVEKNQLTPVRVMIARRQEYSGTLEYNINQGFIPIAINVYPALKTIPAVPGNENTIFMKSLLNDDDWGLRYYALDYLKTIKQDMDNGIIDTLANVALNDRHKLIRAVAEQILNATIENTRTENAVKDSIKKKLSEMKNIKDNLNNTNVDEIDIRELDTAGIMLHNRINIAEMPKPLDSIKSGYVDFYVEIEKCYTDDKSEVHIYRIENKKRIEKGYIVCARNTLDNIDVLRVEDTQGNNEYELSAGNSVQKTSVWVKNDSIITAKVLSPYFIEYKGFGLNDRVHISGNMDVRISDKYIPVDFKSDNAEGGFCDAMKSTDRLTRYYAAGYIVYLNKPINDQTFSYLCELLNNEKDKDVLVRALESAKIIVSKNQAYKNKFKDTLMIVSKTTDKAKKYLKEMYGVE